MALKTAKKYFFQNGRKKKIRKFSKFFFFCTIKKKKKKKIAFKLPETNYGIKNTIVRMLPEKIRTNGESVRDLSSGNPQYTTFGQIYDKMAAILDIGYCWITIGGCNLVLPMFAANFAAIGPGVQDLSPGNQTAEEKKKKKKKIRKFSKFFFLYYKKKKKKKIFFLPKKKKKKIFLAFKLPETNYGIKNTKNFFFQNGRHGGHLGFRTSFKNNRGLYLSASDVHSKFQDDQ